MGSVEIESKLEVDEQDFERLKSCGHVRSHRSLRNIYYDDNYRLSKISSTFRVRVTEGVAVVTLKVPHREEFGYREALEVEWTITEDVLPLEECEFNIRHDLPDEFKKYLEMFGVYHLKLLGEMQTERWLVELADGPKIELDLVHLPNGKSFFEVEFESNNRKEHSQAVNSIKKLAGSARPSLCSKYQRFVNAAFNVST